MKKSKDSKFFQIKVIDGSHEFISAELPLNQALDMAMFMSHVFKAQIEVLNDEGDTIAWL